MLTEGSALVSTYVQPGVSCSTAPLAAPVMALASARNCTYRYRVLDAVAACAPPAPRLPPPVRLPRR